MFPELPYPTPKEGPETNGTAATSGKLAGGASEPLVGDDLIWNWMTRRFEDDAAMETLGLLIQTDLDALEVELSAFSTPAALLLRR